MMFRDGLCSDPCESEAESDLPSSLKKNYQGFLDEVLGDFRILDEDFTSDRVVSDFDDGYRPLEELDTRRPCLRPARDAQLHQPAHNSGKENSAPQALSRQPTPKENPLSSFSKKDHFASADQQTADALLRSSMSIESPLHHGQLKQILEEASFEECEANVSTHAVGLSLNPPSTHRPLASQKPPTRSCLMKPRENRMQEHSRKQREAPRGGALQAANHPTASHLLKSSHQYTDRMRSPPAQKADGCTKTTSHQRHKPNSKTEDNRPAHASTTSTADVPPRKSTTPHNRSTVKQRQDNTLNFPHRSRGESQQTAKSEDRSKSSQTATNRKMHSFSRNRDMVSIFGHGKRGASETTSDPIYPKNNPISTSKVPSRQPSTARQNMKMTDSFIQSLKSDSVFQQAQNSIQPPQRDPAPKIRASCVNDNSSFVLSFDRRSETKPSVHLNLFQNPPPKLVAFTYKYTSKDQQHRETAAKGEEWNSFSRKNGRVVDSLSPPPSDLTKFNLYRHPMSGHRDLLATSDRSLSKMHCEQEPVRGRPTHLCTNSARKSSQPGSSHPRPVHLHSLQTSAIMAVSNLFKKDLGSRTSPPLTAIGQNPQPPKPLQQSGTRPIGSSTCKQLIHHFKSIYLLQNTRSRANRLRRLTRATHEQL